MAASIGQFGTVYIREVVGIGWLTYPAVVMDMSGAELTIMGIVPLDADVDSTEERVYVVRATYSDTPPTSGEHIFVPV